MPTVIDQHRSIAKTDANQCVHIRGDRTDTYEVYYEDQDGKGKPLATLEFQTLQRVGLTNEALLAIVADRLYQFQGGVCACEENAVALQQVNGALAALKARTVRRSNQGIEGKMEEKKAEEKARVRIEGDSLIIGHTGYPLTLLTSWANWSTIESACKKLDPPFTSAEMEVVEKAAAHLGGGARNGLAEFKSAMASTRKG